MAGHRWLYVPVIRLIGIGPSPSGAQTAQLYVNPCPACTLDVLPTSWDRPDACGLQETEVPELSTKDRLGLWFGRYCRCPAGPSVCIVHMEVLQLDRYGNSIVSLKQSMWTGHHK